MPGYRSHFLLVDFSVVVLVKLFEKVDKRVDIFLTAKSRGGLWPNVYEPGRVPSAICWS